jgi:hypothetical protein
MQRLRLGGQLLQSRVGDVTGRRSKGSREGFTKSLCGLAGWRGHRNSGHGCTEPRNRTHDPHDGRRLSGSRPARDEDKPRAKSFTDGSPLLGCRWKSASGDSLDGAPNRARIRGVDSNLHTHPVSNPSAKARLEDTHSLQIEPSVLNNERLSFSRATDDVSHRLFRAWRPRSLKKSLDHGCRFCTAHLGK